MFLIGYHVSALKVIACFDKTYLLKIWNMNLDPQTGCLKRFIWQSENLTFEATPFLTSPSINQTKPLGFHQFWWIIHDCPLCGANKLSTTSSNQKLVALVNNFIIILSLLIAFKDIIIVIIIVVIIIITLSFLISLQSFFGGNQKGPGKRTHPFLSYHQAQTMTGMVMSELSKPGGAGSAGWCRDVCCFLKPTKIYDIGIVGVVTRNHHKTRAIWLQIQLRYRLVWWIGGILWPKKGWWM